MELLTHAHMVITAPDLLSAAGVSAWMSDALELITG